MISSKHLSETVESILDLRDLIVIKASDEALWRQSKYHPGRIYQYLVLLHVLWTAA